MTGLQTRTPFCEGCADPGWPGRAKSWNRSTNGPQSARKCPMLHPLPLGSCLRNNGASPIPPFAVHAAQTHPGLHPPEEVPGPYTPVGDTTNQLGMPTNSFDIFVDVSQQLDPADDTIFVNPLPTREEEG